MPYSRISLVNGDLIDEAVFEKIDNSFDRLYTDIYDKKIYNNWELIDSTTPDLLKVKYDRQSSGSISGWWGCIGKPQNFSRIKFPVKPIEGNIITSIMVKIVIMPPRNEITFTEGSRGTTPRPKDWETVIEKAISFDPEVNPLVDGVYNVIEMEFDSIIENTKGDYLFMAILPNVKASVGLFLKTYEDIPYNGWTYYTTNGSFTGCTPLGSGTHDINSKEVYCLACEFYRKESTMEYIEIDTYKKGKFYELVNNCINNSESFGEIFKESYKNYFACGSLNLLNSTAQHYANSDSSFTGVVFSIGRVPSDIESAGVLLQIRGRSRNGSTDPITRVNVFLYKVKEAPLTATYNGQQFSALEPTLLRSGVVNCEIPVDQNGIVYIPWSEGEFSNADNDFLMLGYECNAFNYRCQDKSTSGADACGALDGNSYGSLETWYSTSKVGGQAWRPRWVDSSVNAWSFVRSEKYYDLGEKFYALLDEAVDKKLGDASLDVNVNIAPTSEVRLAKEYDLVVGDKFQLFYEGVIKGFDVLNEGIYVNCSVGYQYPRYWEFEPTAANAGKSYTLTLATRQLDGTIISEGTTTIKVHPKLTNTTTPENLTVLIFGDSLTDGAKWQIEGLRRIYGTDTSIQPASLGITNTLTTYGTKTHKKNNFTVNHEGYGGWQWSSFLKPERGGDSTTSSMVVTLNSNHNYNLDTVQKSTWIDNNNKAWELEDFPSANQIKFNRGSGNNAPQSSVAAPTSMSCASLSLTITPATVVWESLNPFYDAATDSLDFNKHAEKFGAGPADIVTCLLTWNGGGGAKDFDSSAKINKHMDNASQLLREIHADFPKAKIICLGIQLNSITGGSGASYGSDGGYADTWGTVMYAFEYNKALEELITNDPELSEYCFYIDTKGQFDTRYCMPYKNVAVNTRVTEITEIRGTNGVHPSDAGYAQIGDVFYRALHKVMPLVMDEKEG